MSMTSSKLLYTIIITMSSSNQKKTLKAPKIPEKKSGHLFYLSFPYRGRRFQIRQQQRRFGQRPSHDFLRCCTAASPGHGEKQTAGNKPWEWIDGEEFLQIFGDLRSFSTHHHPQWCI